MVLIARLVKHGISSVWRRRGAAACTWIIAVDGLRVVSVGMGPNFRKIRVSDISELESIGGVL